MINSEPDADSDARVDASTEIEVSHEVHAAFIRMGELDAAPLESFGETRLFNNSDDLFQFLHSEVSDPKWAFRGHSDERWALASSIERLKRNYVHVRSDAEDAVLRTFKRRAHHYIRDLPESGDELEWLSIMRHHGAPTRLLDWTSSPYVAAFFATAEANETDMSAVWAIDISAIKLEAIQLLSDAGVIERPVGAAFSFSDRDVFASVIMEERLPIAVPIVVPVQPFKTSERVTSQQGLFLCSNSSIFGFETGLKHVLKSEGDRQKSWDDNLPGLQPYVAFRLFKLRISPDARRGVIRELYRMNINYATLFPGLDGFSRSLVTAVTMSHLSSVFFGMEADWKI